MQEIDLLAIRCSHCGTALKDMPSMIRRGMSASAGKVVYVLDRDLVRFLKVTTSVLGMFILVGLYLCGIDLKTTQEEMTSGRDTIDKAREEIETDRIRIEESVRKLGQLEKELVGYREASQQSAREAEDALNAILPTQNKVKIVLTELSRERNGALQVRTKTVIADPTVLANPKRGKLWPIGATIRIGFLEGSDEQRAKVRQWAVQWAKYANIKLQFVDSADTDVRIGFRNGDGSWSYVGTDNKVAGHNDRTMNLGWLEEANVLHQFGHVLGFVHEHQIPGNPIPWDEERVYEFYAGPPNHWTRAKTFHNILRENPGAVYPMPKPFDRHSIMLYSFPDELTKGGYPLEAGKTLSEGDQQFVSKLYPKQP